jgi:hypothetical protein
MSTTTTTTTTTVAGSPSDLQVALEVHVEGNWPYATSSTGLDDHLEQLEILMDAAEPHGAVLSFELGNPIVEALINAGRAAWVQEVKDRGHDVQLHADVGGSGVPSLATLVAQLTDQRTDAAALGIDATVVTGVCSKGRWVEAALASGFDAVAGVVEYCPHALDPANDPPEFDRGSCASPAACHDALGSLLGLDLTWHASSSSAFLTDVGDTGAALLMIPGVDGPACGSESTGTSCSWDVGDPAGFAARLETAIANRDSERPSVLTSAWSVGGPVDPAIAEELFERMAEVMADGGARWVRISEVVRATERPA